MSYFVLMSGLGQYNPRTGLSPVVVLASASSRRRLSLTGAFATIQAPEDARAVVARPRGRD